MKQRLVILGAGGNALDVLDVIDSLNDRSDGFEVVGFFDDGRAVGSEYLGFTVLGGLEAAVRGIDEKCMFASAIGSTAPVRFLDRILRRCEVPRARFATLVHAGASVSRRARLGSGVVVNFGASLAGNVAVDDFVFIGPGCIVGHDSTVGSYSALAAGAVLAGGVTVGTHCYVGSGALVRQQQTVGSGALIGMGAVVVGDVPENVTVAGVPAARLRG